RLSSLLPSQSSLANLDARSVAGRVPVALALEPRRLSGGSGCYEVATPGGNPAGGLILPTSRPSSRKCLGWRQSLIRPSGYSSWSPVIGEALSDLDLALAYWSNSHDFITRDIDVVVPRLPELP